MTPPLELLAVDEDICGLCGQPRTGLPIRMRLPIPMSPKQKALAKKHGNPAEFAKACYAACPEFVSMTEAAVAVAKYNKEWAEAGGQTK